MERKAIVKRERSIKRGVLRISGSVVKCLGLLLVLSGTVGVSTASAGYIMALGDETPMAYAGTPDNNVFFNNILGTGTSVLVHETVCPACGPSLSGYYDSLPGVGSSLVSGDITAGLLFGVDLFITGLTGGPLSPGEVVALEDFLDAGGSLLFSGDYTYSFAAVNSALVALGSGLSLYGPPIDIGPWYAFVLLDSLTAGVGSFRYGYAYGVSGGTPLFLRSDESPFLAYETYNNASPIPEPSTILLLGAGLVGLGLWGRKRMVK